MPVRPQHWYKRVDPCEEVWFRQHTLQLPGHARLAGARGPIQKDDASSLQGHPFTAPLLEPWLPTRPVPDGSSRPIFYRGTSSDSNRPLRGPEITPDTSGASEDVRPGRTAIRGACQLPFTRKAPYRAAKCMLEERSRPLRLHHEYCWPLLTTDLLEGGYYFMSLTHYRLAPVKGAFCARTNRRVGNESGRRPP